MEMKAQGAFSALPANARGKREAGGGHVIQARRLVLEQRKKEGIYQRKYKNAIGEADPRKRRALS